MDQMKTGGFLKTLRKEKNLTQEQLAERLGVSGRTVSRWETGNNMPDISLLVEIVDFYDVSIPELIDGERKSENMNEEVREVVDKMADYAGTEKASMIKNIRNISFLGVFSLGIRIILIRIVSWEILSWIQLYCESFIHVSLIMVFLISTGLLYKIENKQKEINLRKSMWLIVGIVAAIIAAVIVFMLSSISFS